VTILDARRGRPRNPDADRAIIEATLELVAEEGIGALSVESVAVRAGVGKATIYRRWASKEALVVDALTSLNDELPPVPTEGSLRDRIVEMVDRIRCKSMDTVSGRIMPRMLSYGICHPELFQIYYERVLDPRRERFRVLLREGLASGELRPGLDVDFAVTLFSAPMIYMHLTSAGPARETTEALVDAVLYGISAREPSNRGASAREASDRGVSARAIGS
jgi:AcrR family transcriptional regulator